MQPPPARALTVIVIRRGREAAFHQGSPTAPVRLCLGQPREGEGNLQIFLPPMPRD
jgi:hypothetical protein